MNYRSSIVAAILFLIASVSCLAAPTVVDPNLTVDTLATGLDSPTGMVFLPDNDALVIEKNTGQVQLFHGGAITHVALDLPVANNSEEGLLGIALHPDFASDGFVYLYYTLSSADGGAPINNVIGRYHWNGSTLTFDKVIADLPTQPGPNHNGGKILFGPDGKLYAVIGELNRREQTENNQSSTAIHRAGVILRLNKGGKSPTDNPFYSAANIGTSRAPLNDIFAYGVRNSFGMAFDPITGMLWDTENGPANFDEINRVRAGFNSGWTTIQGPLARNPGASVSQLVSFGPAAFYVDPQFSWVTTVAPTDIHFQNNTLLGGIYQNTMFVGDNNTGSLFHFDLSADRKTLALSGPLADRVADNTSSDLLAEQSSILFGSGFGTTTSIINGPDGMYVTSVNGQIYRIRQKVAPAQPAGNFAAVPLPAMVWPMAILIIAIIAARLRSPLPHWGRGLG